MPAPVCRTYKLQGTSEPACSCTAEDYDEREAFIIEKVVSAKLNVLDQGFLDALEGFSKSSRKGKNDYLAGEVALAFQRGAL